jgi:hypothetical protein
MLFYLTMKLVLCSNLKTLYYAGRPYVMLTARWFNELPFRQMEPVAATRRRCSLIDFVTENGSVLVYENCKAAMNLLTEILASR